MNFRGLIFSFLATSLMLVSCRESNNPAPPLSSVTERDQEKPNTIEFSKPALIIVQKETDNYLITNPKSVEPFIARTNDQLPGMAAVPQDAGISTTSMNYPMAITGMESGNGTKSPVIVRNPVILRNPAIQSYIWPYTGFEILLDNDLFSNTDRYYTNGVQIRYRSPAMAFWRINSILPVNIRESMEYNSLELHHGMYTPFTTKEPPLLKGDRPYAATMYLRFNRRSESPEKGIVQSASFDIGVMGEAALGSTLQKGVHAGLPTNDEPLGWETQIGNDIIINYNYQLLRQLASTGPISIYSISEGSLGTLNTSAETGIGIKIGTDKYFLAPLPQNLTNLNRVTGSKWHFVFESNFTTRVVGYNATLNGGIMNKNNIYVLKPEEIERLLFTAEARIDIRYSEYGISLAQYFITKEFNKGKSHFWGQIGLNIRF